MKKIIVFLLFLTAAFASDILPVETVQSLAVKIVTEKFGAYRIDGHQTFYGFDEQPMVYALTFRNVENKPLTIIMGARYSCSPVDEITFDLPRSTVVYDHVLDLARDFSHAEPVFTRVYYYGPGEEYVGFKCDRREILVNACTYQVFDRSVFDQRTLPANPELENLTRGKWQKYLDCPSFASRDSNYVDSVPFIDWVYGCTPTAASMILWYWDVRGYGKLVDYFFTHWDYPENEWNECANTNRELALAMNTDTMSGGTYISAAAGGIVNVCNSINGYSFSASTSGAGSAGNQYQFSWIKNEITNQKPCHWNVLYYYYSGQFINHSITGVGYGITATDTFVRVHTTWDNGEPYWPLWTYNSGQYSVDYVVTVTPNGANPNNIFGASPPTGTQVFKNLKYRINWTTPGTIDHVKIAVSRGSNNLSYDTTRWSVVTTNAPNTGSYLWVVPNNDTNFRVNIIGLNSSNQRQAADGYFNPVIPVFPAHTPNLNLFGVDNTDGSAEDVYVAGNYAYICDATNGLIVEDISDSSLPVAVYRLPINGDASNCFPVPPYLYISDKSDTLRVISLANPTAPVEYGKCAMNVDQPYGLCVAGDYAYVSGRSSGLAIFNVSNPAAPVAVTTFNTPGQAYDVLVSGTTAYIADGTFGVRIVNVSNPSTPVELGFYNTSGSAQGLAINGNALYVADGASGVAILNVQDPANPALLGTFNTPGTAKSVLFSESLFVADATYGIRALDVSNPAAPVDVGYIGCFGSATHLVHYGSLIGLADGPDGLYVIREEITTGVQEKPAEVVLPEIRIRTLNSGSIRFEIRLAENTDLAARLYDVSGRLVNTLNRSSLARGNHRFGLAGPAAGVYFLEIRCGQNVMAKKVVVVN